MDDRSPHHSDEEDNVDSSRQHSDEDDDSPLGLFREFVEVLYDLRMRQLLTFVFGISTMFTIKFSTWFLQTPSRTRKQVEESNPIIFIFMHIAYLLSMMYAAYLQIRISCPNLFPGNPREYGYSSSEEFTTEGESDPEQPNPNDAESQQPSQESEKDSPAAEIVSEDVATTSTESESLPRRPRTRSTTRKSPKGPRTRSKSRGRAESSGILRRRTSQNP